MYPLTQASIYQTHHTTPLPTHLHTYTSTEHTFWTMHIWVLWEQKSNYPPEPVSQNQEITMRTDASDLFTNSYLIVFLRFSLSDSSELLRLNEFQCLKGSDTGSWPSLICEKVISCEEKLLCLRDFSSCLTSAPSSLPPSLSFLHALSLKFWSVCPLVSILFHCYICLPLLCIHIVNELYNNYNKWWRRQKHFQHDSSRCWICCYCALPS